MEKSEILALIESLGITYDAQFVPFNQSRNKDNDNVSLNWKITISKGRQSITTDYMQGIGHLPNYLQSMSNLVSYRNYLKTCAVDGKYNPAIKDQKSFIAQYNRAFGAKIAPIPKPELVDVLYCICTDADVINYSSFEEWANNFGYDEDSRQAEKIYRECLEIALKLRSMLGDSNMQKLQEAFQDY